MGNLIFVTGLRKSGTSMVKTLLDGHPEVFMFPANEFELFHYSHHDAFNADKVSREQDFGVIRDKLVHNSFIERLNRPKHKGDLRTSIDVEGFQRMAKERSVQSYRDIIDVCFEAMAANCSYFSGDIGVVHHAMKCVLNEEYLPEILSWYPGAKMVYVLRNPYGHFNAIRNSLRRGVTTEGQKLSNFRNAYPVLGLAIRRMRLSYLFMEKWRELYPENFYVLVYDRILQNPATELRRLSRFLGISFDEALLKPTVGGEIWVGNSWKVPSFDKIDTRPLNHWRKDISDFELALVNKYFGEVLKRYGFEMILPRASSWMPAHISERPLAYLLNRLTLRATTWFGGSLVHSIEEQG